MWPCDHQTTALKQKQQKFIFYLLTSANTLFFPRQDARCVNDANALQDLVGDLRADEPGGIWRQSIPSVTKANTCVSTTTVCWLYIVLRSETADTKHTPLLLNYSLFNLPNAKPLPKFASDSNSNVYNTRTTKITFGLMARFGHVDSRTSLSQSHPYKRYSHEYNYLLYFCFSILKSSIK